MDKRYILNWWKQRNIDFELKFQWTNLKRIKIKKWQGSVKLNYYDWFHRQKEKLKIPNRKVRLQSLYLNHNLFWIRKRTKCTHARWKSSKRSCNLWKIAWYDSLNLKIWQNFILWSIWRFWKPCIYPNFTSRKECFPVKAEIIRIKKFF